MIQRPQSILLVIVAILYGLLAFAPLWLLNAPSGTIVLDATSAVLTNPDGEEIARSSNVYLLATSACGAILAIITLFLFKNRSLQARLAAFNTLILVIFVGLMVFLAHPHALKLAPAGATGGSYGWGFYLTVAILALDFVANRMIRKDEALVKSVDRIR